MHTTLLFIGGLGGGEVTLILAAMLLFFGANKIPQLARGLGQGIREFKDASNKVTEHLTAEAEPTPSPAPPKPLTETSV